MADPRRFLLDLSGENGIAKSQILALLKRTLEEHNYKVLPSSVRENTYWVEAPQLGAK